MTKAITLWQPYASFIAWGIKEYETRSWQPSALTLRRGQTLLIHAAKRKPTSPQRQAFTDVMRNPYVRDLATDHRTQSIDDLPRGALVCAVRFVRAYPTSANLRDELNPLEKRVGDFSPGRWAWQLELIKVADPPVPATGQQGIWNYTPEAPADDNTDTPKNPQMLPGFSQRGQFNV